MKKLVFWGNLTLNLIALMLAISWVRSESTYEAWVSLLAIAASTVTLFSSKPHWIPVKGSVTQIGNVAGGDIAGGNISKK